MARNLVRDWMTPDPITISPTTTLPEARKLMLEYRVRRLPVIDRGNLVGIVTLGDVRAAGASNVSAISVFDLNYILAGLSIDQIMTREPVTVAPEDELTEAAQRMLDHKVGALPVVSAGKLVGIITESDIFRALVQGAFESASRPAAAVSTNHAS